MTNEAQHRSFLSAVQTPNKDSSEGSTGSYDPLKLITRDFVLQGEKLAVNFEDERMTSIISSSTKSTGNIVSSEGYRVDGHHEGDIQASTIFITENGYVNGKLQANRVIVQGQVRGEIRANKEIILTSTADVFGKIYYKDIATFRGHRFEGGMYRIK